MMVPAIEPLPPESWVPPMTTAAIASSSGGKWTGEKGTISRRVATSASSIRCFVVADSPHMPPEYGPAEQDCESYRQPEVASDGDRLAAQSRGEDGSHVLAETDVDVGIVRKPLGQAADANHGGQGDHKRLNVQGRNYPPLSAPTAAHTPSAAKMASAMWLA